MYRNHKSSSPRKIHKPQEGMDNTNERTPLVEGRIAASTKLAYALGHIFNDLAAAMWFSYTLIYLQRVVLLQPIVAGALLFLGECHVASCVPTVLSH